MNKITNLETLRQNITIPATDFIEQGADFLRFTYHMNGNEYNVLLSGAEEIGKFLQDHDFIAEYDVIDGELLLSVDAPVIYAGRDGEPVQVRGAEGYTWSEYRDSVNSWDAVIVKHLAVKHEHDKAPALPPFTPKTMHNDMKIDTSESISTYMLCGINFYITQHTWKGLNEIGFHSFPASKDIDESESLTAVFKVKQRA